MKKQFRNLEELNRAEETWREAEEGKYPKTDEGQNELLTDILIGKVAPTADFLKKLESEGYDLNDLVASGEPYCYGAGVFNDGTKYTNQK